MTTRSRRVAVGVVVVAVWASLLVTGGGSTTGPGRTTAPSTGATLLVKLGDTSDAAVAELATTYEVRVARRFPQIGWIEVEAGKRAAALAATLGADPEVLAVDSTTSDEQLVPAYVPNDPIFTGGSYTNGPALSWHLAKLDLPAAWDVTRGSSSTVVAAIDSEFDTTNPDLAAKLLPGWNVKSGTLGYHTAQVRATDQEIAASGGCSIVHGTHVAGLIAADAGNGKGTAGAGFDVRVLPIRTSFNVAGAQGSSDAAFVADVTEAVLYAADHGVAVINMSFATTRPHDPLRDALAYASTKGVTLVAAAGNDQSAQTGVTYYPAAYPGVIAVGATTSDDTVATFSPTSGDVDLAAPGVRILSTWDSRCNDSASGQFNNDGVVLDERSGTSMSAALVSGVVGLMKSVRPDLTPAEVEQILTSTARDLGPVGRDATTGAGLVDAYRAVVAARDLVRPQPPAPPGAGTPATPAPPALPAVLGSKIGYHQRSGKVTASVTCVVACSVKVKAKARGTTSRPVRFSLLAAGAKKVTLVLDEAAVARAARSAKSGRTPIKVSVRVTTASGLVLTLTKTVLVKA